VVALEQAIFPVLARLHVRSPDAVHLRFVPAEPLAAGPHGGCQKTVLMSGAGSGILKTWKPAGARIAACVLQQRPSVGEMPIEASLGHAERLRQGLDPDGVRAAGGEGPQALLDPPATGRPGDGGHEL